MTEQPEAKRRPDAVTVIAIYHFVEAALALIGLLGLGIAALAVNLHAAGEVSIIGPMLALGLAALITIVLVALDIVAGWGLLVLHDWARWMAIVLSVFRLVFLPIGTIIGALIIYFLLQQEVKEAFEAP